MQRISQIFKNFLNCFLMKIIKIENVMKDHENNVNNI